MALMMPEEPGSIVRLQSFLSFLWGSTENSGTAIFRHFYMLQNSQIVDVINDGQLACALCASTHAVVFQLLRQIHTCVKDLEDDARASGWVAGTLRPGAMVFWPERATQSGKHRHVGYYHSFGRCISHLDTIRAPGVHRLSYHGNLPELVLVHEKLTDSA